jgi:L-asparagine transporter-like permease
VYDAVVLAAINIYSSKLAGSIQIIFTVAKLAALVIVIVGGLVKLCQGINGFSYFCSWKIYST